MPERPVVLNSFYEIVKAVFALLFLLMSGPSRGV
jgi:hypothetical protein